MSVYAAFAVLTLHTNGCFWDFSATERYWKTANIIECIFYFAVPLFLMITGITLMDFFDRCSLREYFARRIRKTVIPFAAWSLIGLMEKLAIGRVHLEDVNLLSVYQGITGSKYVSIYWFFTALFCIYLSLPLFAAVEKERRKEVYTYLVIAGFVLNLLLPFIKSVFSFEMNTPYAVGVVSGYLIWLPLGYLLHNCELNRPAKAVVYLLAFVGLLLHIIGTYELSMTAGKIIRTFKGYNNVPCILYSVGVFLLLKDLGRKVMTARPAPFIKWLGKYTFPIYLMQFILLDACEAIDFINTRSIVYRLGAPFLMIPLIILATAVMRKIPVVRRIVP